MKSKCVVKWAIWVFRGYRSMKILILGPQGSGKGTVGKMLCERLNIAHVSSGELLRNLPVTHPKFQEVQDTMNKGDLVSQKLVASLIRERVEDADCSKGYLLDGWGRAMIDLKYFDPGFDVVLVLNISRETSVKRITGRRICDTDGQTYNIYTLPREELEKCTGNLIQREDDTEEAVNHRLDIYYSETLDVINHFKSKGLVTEVDAEGMPDEVLQNICNALGVKSA